jgi:hypothetical protein
VNEAAVDLQRWRNSGWVIAGVALGDCLAVSQSPPVVRASSPHPLWHWGPPLMAPLQSKSEAGASVDATGREGPRGRVYEENSEDFFHRKAPIKRECRPLANEVELSARTYFPQVVRRIWSEFRNGRVDSTVYAVLRLQRDVRFRPPTPA